MVAVDVGEGGNGDDDDGAHNRKGGCPLVYSKLPALAFPSLGRRLDGKGSGDPFTLYVQT
ncbi:putative proline-rich receptor-like protein kinase PERK13 [Iris pallida]|uniref:Proline-rich receptor-like protein kinase PERK13 n=1 Tax=Iris pallida TaxID=29817 RepID=A0AAX6GWU9_IRIPA|nr:putative proline-rich receptor-like protein kinase PERK13 [Iris pallida]